MSTPIHDLTTQHGPAQGSEDPSHHHQRAAPPTEYPAQHAPEKRRQYAEPETLYRDVNSLLNPEPPASQQQSSGPPPTKKRATASSARTGQACDRCKNRKIRCDPNPDGCMPCRQNNTECKTTDRITGRASVRGHVDLMERDNAVMRQHISELQEQLRHLGVEPKPLPKYVRPTTTSPPTMYAATQLVGQLPRTQDEEPHWKQSPNDSARARTDSPRAQADTYLGVSPYSEGLSAVKGMSMSLFGVEFDIGEFITEATSQRVKMMSLESTLDAMFLIARSGQKPKADLPATYDECKGYVNWYLIAINAYFPILHAPVFVDLITKLYNEKYQPTIPETVMIHIMLAIMKYLYGIKMENKGVGNSLVTEAMAHYHYTLNFWKEMLSSRTVADVQALTMTCVFVRWLASPDNAWSVTNTVFSILIDRRYNHRPTKPYDISSSKEEILEQELQKRLFYTCLCLMVKLNGRLGRPMSIKREDYDVELPRLLNDDFEEAESGHDPHQCNYYMIIPMAHEAEILLDMYSTIFALHPTIDYEEGIAKLERKIEMFSKGLPHIVSAEALAKGKVSGMTKTNALWMEYANHDFQIKLHHPALCRSQKPRVINRNLDICVKSSKEVLDISIKLWHNESNDPTWAFITDTAAAIFTLLYALWERKDQTTLNDWSELKTTTDVAVPMIGEIATMFGCGAGFRESLQKHIDNALEHIRRYHMEKTVVAAAAAVGAELNNAPSKLASFSVPVTEDLKHIPENGKAHYVPAASIRDEPDSQPSPPLAVPQNTQLANLPSPPAQAFAPYKAPTYQEPALPQYDYNTYHQTPTAESNYAMLHAQQSAFSQYTSNHDINYNQSYIPHLSWREWAESAREHGANNPANQAYMPTNDTIMTLGNSNNNNNVETGQQELHQTGYTLGLSSSSIQQVPSSAIGAGAFSNMIPDVHFHAAMAEQSWTPSNAEHPRQSAASHEQRSKQHR